MNRLRRHVPLPQPKKVSRRRVALISGTLKRAAAAFGARFGANASSTPRDGKKVASLGGKNFHRSFHMIE